MTSARNTRLPDPDAARRVISEAVPEFGPRIAAQAAEHATALAPFLEWRRLQQSWTDVPALMYDICGWSNAMHVMLSSFMTPDASALLGDISAWSRTMGVNMPLRYSSNDPAFKKDYDAAAAPDEPRRLARARAAIAVITTAAGASTKLAQAVDTWHQVAGHLF